MLSTFGPIDWAVLGVYLAVMVAIGAAAARKQHDTSSYFLAGRSMPAWAVSLSILATSLSAATFIGVPQISFNGDLSYLILNIGGIIAAIVVATVFIPPIYRAGTLTIYGYLGKRFGVGAMIGASAAFLVGRLLASGARLFIGAIAFSLILFDRIELNYLIVAILIFGGIGTLYTVFGGIRAVIWTDVIQIIVVVGAAMLSIYLLLDAIGLSLGQIIETLRHGNGPNKLQIVDTDFDLAKAFTLWAAFAVVFSETAAYGVDQDLAQRMLTTRSAWRAGWSLVASKLLSIPVVGMFMVIGLLLSIFYGMPDLMGQVEPLDDTRKVYPQFLVNHMPKGLAGLAMAGLFAAAMSSLDSAVNAMASSVVADLYIPWRRARGRPFDGKANLKTPRLVAAVMGAMLTIFAIGAAVMQSAGGQQLVNFALGIMAFAYAGLLGVFLTALVTRRGNTVSAIAAMVVGAVTVLLMQPYMVPAWFDFGLAWPWWMVIATPISFLVCFAGSPRPVGDRTRTAT